MSQTCPVTTKSLNETPGRQVQVVASRSDARASPFASHRTAQSEGSDNSCSRSSSWRTNSSGNGWKCLDQASTRPTHQRCLPTVTQVFRSLRRGSTCCNQRCSKLLTPICPGPRTPTPLPVPQTRQSPTSLGLPRLRGSFPNLTAAGIWEI